MHRTNKFKALQVKPADAEKDIALINQFAVKELHPEDIYCFSVVLCDNEIDRDLERFTDKALGQLKDLMVGRTGITDHRWSSAGQFSRLYRTEVKDTTEKTSYGAPLKQLIGSAYMVRSKDTQPTIDAIEAGILKEVSIGFSAKCNCSICGEPLRFNWGTWTERCENGHEKGVAYEEGQCVGLLEDPSDAYEFSFVAVPAQPGAGVTKGAEDLDAAVETLLAADLHERPDVVEKLIPRLKAAALSIEERKQRDEFIKFAEQYRSAKN